MKTFSKNENGAIVCTQTVDGSVDVYEITLERMESELSDRKEALIVAQEAIAQLESDIEVVSALL